MKAFEIFGTIRLDDKEFKTSITDAKVKMGLFHRAMTLAAGGTAILSKGMSMVSNSIGAAVSRVDTLNQFPKVLGQMGYTADQAAKSTKTLVDGIQGLPTRLDEVAATAQRLTVLTGNLDKATNTTLSLNNAMLASGASADAAARGSEAYISMLSSGEVSMMRWRALQETMGYALQQTAESFGFAGASAQNDLYKAIQDGVITFDEFNNKLIELNDGVGGFAELAKTATEGIQTGWQNMQSAITRGTAAIINALDSGKDAGLGIANVFEFIGKQIFEKTLMDIASGVQAFVRTISNSSLIENAKLLMTAIRESGEGLMPILQALSDFALNVFKVAIDGISGSLKFFAENLNIIKGVLVTVVSGFAALKASMMITGLVTALTTAIGAQSVAVTNLARSMATQSAFANIGMATNYKWLASTNLATIATGVLTGKISILTAVKALSIKATMGLTAAWKAFNAVLKANPIIAVITVVTLLITGLVQLYKTSEKARDIMKRAFEALPGPIKAVIELIGKAINKFKELTGIARKSAASMGDALADERAALQQARQSYEDYADTVIESTGAAGGAMEDAAEKHKSLINGMIEAEKRYQNELESRASAIYSSFGSIFDILEYEDPITPHLKSLSGGLDAQVREMERWASDIQTLTERGVDEGLIAELEAGGKQGAELIRAMVNSSDFELTRLADIWKSKHELARNKATSELKQLRKDTDKEIQGMMNELASTGGKGGFKTGEEMINGMIDGLKSNEAKLKNTLVKMLADLQKEANKELEVSSPSKKFFKMFRWVGQGAIDGIKSMEGKLQDAMADVFSFDANDINFGISTSPDASDDFTEIGIENDDNGGGNSPVNNFYFQAKNTLTPSEIRRNVLKAQHELLLGF